jgi:hypothetical protein
VTEAGSGSDDAEGYGGVGPYGSESPGGSESAGAGRVVIVP